MKLQVMKMLQLNFNRISKFDQVEGKVSDRNRSSPVFQLWPEVPDKTLDWPSSAVSQSADGVALNLQEKW